MFVKLSVSEELLDEDGLNSYSSSPLSSKSTTLEDDEVSDDGDESRESSCG